MNANRPLTTPAATVIKTILILAVFLLQSPSSAIVVSSTDELAFSKAAPTAAAHSQADTSNQAVEYKSIKVLHGKLDVDADGEVDDSESKTFLESDRNVDGAVSIAHKLRYLHRDGKDRSITVDELWQAWKSSQAHNWTTDDTIYWLNNYVELPEYSKLFLQHSVNGTMLPRLAADSHFVSKLGVTDPSAKSKISIKAMDVVLFGPPKMGNSSKLRDTIVSIIVVIAISTCGFLYSRQLASQKELRAIQDSKLESLQKAEIQLSDLQNELNKALQAQKAVVTEKMNLENQLKMQRQFSSSSVSDRSRSGSVTSNHNPLKPNNGENTTRRGDNHEALISKMELELKKLRKELQETYDAMSAKKFRAPQPLRALLQTTYNIESQYFNEKKQNLETKAAEVKLRNQKLQKKKASFLGYYKMAQENSLEEDINNIVEVKEGILQVTKQIRERVERWRAIEEFCGCNLELNSSSSSSLSGRASAKGSCGDQAIDRLTSMS